MPNPTVLFSAMCLSHLRIWRAVLDPLGCGASSVSVFATPHDILLSGLMKHMHVHVLQGPGLLKHVNEARASTCSTPWRPITRRIFEKLATYLEAAGSHLCP